MKRLTERNLFTQLVIKGKAFINRKNFKKESVCTQLSFTNKNFKEGTIIKGKDLEGYTLCKILSEDMTMQNFQYKLGMNEDINPLAMEGSCMEGLYFCPIQDICRFLYYGTKLALVRIPDDEDVYVDIWKFRTHRLEVKKIMHLNEVSTWEYLIQNGADVALDNNKSIQYSAQNGYLEVINYLREHITDVPDNYLLQLAAQRGHLHVVKHFHNIGADITANDNTAVKYASENNHLEIVKYLHEHGADITSENDFALRYAARNGNLNVVKYLYENGANITTDNNFALRIAAFEGHLDVVKYLHLNGADITACNNCALHWATKYGHLDVAQYLKENGA